MAEMEEVAEKRHSYTLDFKLKLLEWYHSNGENKQLTSRVFNVQPKRITEWLIIEQQLKSKKDSPGGKRRSSESTTWLKLQVDKLLVEWHKEKGAEGVKPTLNQLRSKALELAIGLGLHNFKASSSWIKQWKKRHEESGEIEDDGSRSVHVVTISPPLTDDDNYDNDDDDDDSDDDDYNDDDNSDYDGESDEEDEEQVGEMNDGDGRSGNKRSNTLPSSLVSAEMPLSASGSSSTHSSTFQTLLDALGQQISAANGDSTKKMNQREQEQWIALIQQSVDSLASEFHAKISQIKLLLDHLNTSIQQTPDTCTSATNDQPSPSKPARPASKRYLTTGSTTPGGAKRARKS